MGSKLGEDLKKKRGEGERETSISERGERGGREGAVVEAFQLG